MSSGAGNKIANAYAVVIQSKGAILKNYDHLKRRTSLVDAGLKASSCINLDRITKFLVFKAHKEYAMRENGVKLGDFESLKANAYNVLEVSKDDSAIVAFDTIRMFSESIAMEKIADAAFKASKILNWDGCEERVWGNIADAGFKLGNKRRRKNMKRLYNLLARHEYVLDAFGVQQTDFECLAYYAEKIFHICNPDAQAIAGQAIAIEKIVDAALKASKTFYLYNREPINMECHREGTFKFDSTDTEDVDTFKFSDDEDEDEDEDEDPAAAFYKHEEPGFMKSRDEMSIFKDSDETRDLYRRYFRRQWASPSITNWARIVKFLEFKARKEYAMETYGVKLGDFESLKENALKLFRTTEIEAAKVASKTMAMDSKSIAVEKIAEAAFKSSKIINWSGGNETYLTSWQGNVADPGFKSPKSMMNYCKNMDLEARKAYTMEAFGVNSVDIDYLKDYAKLTFENFHSSERLDEHDAVIMACQTIAIDNIVEATSNNLNLTLHLVDPKENTGGTMVAPKHFSAQERHCIFCS